MEYKVKVRDNGEHGVYLYIKVYYNDWKPVSNAVVMIEKMGNYDNKLIGYCVANKTGEILVTLDDRNSYYKLTAFDGKINEIY